MANGTVRTAPMKINIVMLEVARLGFEPRSTGPKPVMMDPYTIGLGYTGGRLTLLFLSELHYQKDST